MIIAIDVKYNEETKTAKAVGILFNWLDDKSQRIISKIISNVDDYIPGQFYKRELPCIKAVIEEINLKEIEIIIVDGHIFIDNNENYGLGGYVFKEFNEQIPVIGVAKTFFKGNEKTVKSICRGQSNKPLFVSSIGIKLEVAIENVTNMHGKFRIPTLLKEVDRLSKEV